MKNKLLEALCKAKTVAVSGHVRSDGDCVGSCMALYHYIKDNYADTKAVVFLEPVVDSYKVLDGTENIVSDSESDEIFDLFVVLDCGDRERLGAFAKYFDHAKKTLCIDHHISNTGFADEDVICPEASSTCEVLSDLFDMDKVGSECAKALYMGIMCDTGCFKHTNTSEHTMTVAGRLISKGVHTEKMMDEVFYEKTYMQNKLLGECLLESRLYLDGRVIAAKVPQALLSKYGAVSSDLEGVIDQLRLTKGTEAAILMTEGKDGSFKVSMRAKDKVNVSEIAVSLGGGGHIKAAGATVYADADETLVQIIERIGEQLKNND